MDHLAPLLRDSAMRVVNCAEGEWLRKAKEDKKRKKQQKLQVQERGEDTDDDDDGDDDEVMEEEESVADDIEWDNLENEDVLTGVRTLSFHGGEGTSGEPVEVGHTVGLP